MFLRKLMVLLVPLGLLILLALLASPLSSLGAFWGNFTLGAALGIALALMLPLAGATRLREPFAWLLWIPATVILLVLLYQYLASMGTDVPLLHLLAVNDTRLIFVESAFAAYMLTFSIRTGRGI